MTGTNASRTWTVREILASAGLMNPQIRFGEDLMSRVSYAMMNPQGAAQMTAVVRKAIRRLIADTAVQAGIPAEDVLEITLVGNPDTVPGVGRTDPHP